MKIALLIGLLLFFSLWLAAGIMGFRVLGKMLETLYTNDRGLWEWEGKPYAMFVWAPPEGESFSGNLMGTIMVYKLWFTTPAWLSVVPNGSKLRNRLRFFSLLQITSIIVLFVLVQFIVE